MPLIIFSFAFNSDTKEATFAGTVDPIQALQILQQIAIDNAVSEAKKQDNVEGKP